MTAADEVSVAALDDPAGLRAACHSCDVVFHAAAVVGRDATLAIFGLAEVQVGPTETLLRAADASDVGRFVFTSSTTVYGGSPPDAADEDTPLRPGSAYAAAKADGERVCFAWMARRGLPVSVVRPCFVYGPGDRNFTPFLAAVARRRLIPLVDGGHLPIDVVHVDDVAEAHLLAASVPAAAGRAYNVTDGHRRSLRRLIELAAEALRVRAHVVAVPRWAGTAAAVALRAIASAGRTAGHEMLSRSAVAGLATPHHYSIARAQRELGYSPQHRAEEAFRLALPAYVSAEAR